MSNPTNKVEISGVLPFPPDINDTNSGNPVANLKLFHPAGKQHHMFIVRSYGELAVEIDDNVKEGDEVLVSGRLKQERWTHKETGKPVNRIVVVADKIAILSHDNEVPLGINIPGENR